MFFYYVCGYQKTAPAKIEKIKYPKLYSCKTPSTPYVEEAKQIYCKEYCCQLHCQNHLTDFLRINILSKILL
jgi:hypothetical protein